jgi:hypothetical protein
MERRLKDHLSLGGENMKAKSNRGWGEVESAFAGLSIDGEPSMPANLGQAGPARCDGHHNAKNFRRQK